MRTSGSLAELEVLRMVAGRMFAMGRPPVEIAAAVGRDDQTVRRWRREWRAGGVEALKARRHPGPAPRLSRAQWLSVIDLLGDGPRHHGFDAYLWTAALIGKLIEQKFGVRYHHDYVGEMLHELGWSPQRPAKQARERDDAAILRWCEQEWERLKKKSRDLDAVIVFADEAGFSMVPCLKSTWAPVGRTPVVRHRNRWHRKVSVLGAIAIFPDGSDPQLLSDWYPDRHIKKEEAVAFLERLVKHFAGRHVILIWDKLAAHRSKLVKQFVADHPGLETHHLPSYAPDLNPVEMVWSLSKHHRMANHGIDDLPTLEAQARRHVGEIGANPTLLNACIRHARLDRCA